MGTLRLRGLRPSPYEFGKTATCFLLVTLVMVSCAYGGTITGSLKKANGKPINAGVITLTLSQAGTSGATSLTTDPVYCGTSATGAVVGIADPYVAPQLSANYGSGSLPGGATYYVVYTYTGATGESQASPEATLIMTASGTLNVAAPTLQPENATGYKVYIGTAQGAETLQATVTGFGPYSQSVNVVAASAPPTSNTTSCSGIFFNDAIVPSYTTYKVNVVDGLGKQVAGYPQQFYLQGVAVDLSTMQPAGNLYARFPNAIVSQPAGNGVQSIAGGLNIAGYDFWARNIFLSGSLTGLLTGSFNGNINGAISVKAAPYNAAGDGVTDDTAAFQAAINDATVSAILPKTILVPHGTYVVSQLNATDIFGQQGGSPKGSLHIVGGSGVFGAQSTIQCKEASPNTGVCIDLSGSDEVTMEGLRILGGTSASDAPKVVILTARTTTDLGWSNGFYFRNLDVETYGKFGWYSYGGEEVKWELSRFVYNGTYGGGGEANVVLSNINNFYAITSPFKTLLTGDVSMTVVEFDGGTLMGCANLNSYCIKFENANTNPFGGIDDIKISGYANLGSDHARAFLGDMATGELHNITIDNRVESAHVDDTYLTFQSASIKGLRVYGTYAHAHIPSGPPITFTNATGTIGEGSVINFQPADRQNFYPATMVSCTMPANFIFGLKIYDRNKTGGGNLPNACPGADEQNGATSGAYTDGAGNYTTPGFIAAGNRKALASDFTDANSASLQAITGLSYTLQASKTYSFVCSLMYSQATNVAGDQFGVGVITTAPANVNAFGQAFTNTGAAAPESVGVLNALTTTTPTAVVTLQPAVTTVLGATLRGTVETGAGTSTFGPYVLNGTAADVIVIKRGSYCELF